MRKLTKEQILYIEKRNKQISILEDSNLLHQRGTIPSPPLLVFDTASFIHHVIHQGTHQFIHKVICQVIHKVIHKVIYQVNH